MKKMTQLSTVLAIGLLSACGTTAETADTPQEVTPTVEQLSATPSDTHATPEHAVEQIRIAFLIDDDNPDSSLVFETFRAELETYLDIPVVTIEGATHLVGIEAMRAGNLEMMWGSPFVYLLAQGALDVERLVTTDSPNVINKTVFITANDAIQSMDDLAGHTFAFASAGSTSGFLYPMYHLINMTGYTQEQLLTGSFFSAASFSGGQTPSMMGVLYGDFDAAAVGHIQFNNALNSGVIPADTVRVLDSTELIPFPGYIATSALPRELLDRIQAFLIAYDNDFYFDTRFGDTDVRFEAPDQAQIDYLTSMVQTLGIDLETAN